MQNIEHDIRKHDKYFITQDFVEDHEKTYLEKIEKVLRLGVKIIQLNFKIFVPTLCFTWFVFHLVEGLYTNDIIKRSINR